MLFSGKRSQYVFFDGDQSSQSFEIKVIFILFYIFKHLVDIISSHTICDKISMLSNHMQFSVEIK